MSVLLRRQGRELDPRSPPKVAGGARRGRPRQPAGAAAPRDGGEKPMGAGSQQLANRYRVGKRCQLGCHPNAKGNSRRMAQDPPQGKRSRQERRRAGNYTRDKIHSCKYRHRRVTYLTQDRNRSLDFSFCFRDLAKCDGIAAENGRRKELPV